MNNVNVEAIEKFVETIQNDPEAAKKHKKVTGSENTYYYNIRIMAARLRVTTR